MLSSSMLWLVSLHVLSKWEHWMLFQDAKPTKTWCGQTKHHDLGKSWDSNPRSADCVHLQHWVLCLSYSLNIADYTVNLSLSSHKTEKTEVGRQEYSYFNWIPIDPNELGSTMDLQLCTEAKHWRYRVAGEPMTPSNHFRIVLHTGMVWKTN